MTKPSQAIPLKPGTPVTISPQANVSTSKFIAGSTAQDGAPAAKQGASTTAGAKASSSVQLAATSGTAQTAQKTDASASQTAPTPSPVVSPTKLPLPLGKLTIVPGTIVSQSFILTLPPPSDGGKTAPSSGGTGTSANAAAPKPTQPSTPSPSQPPIDNDVVFQTGGTTSGTATVNPNGSITFNTPQPSTNAPQPSTTSLSPSVQAIIANQTPVNRTQDQVKAANFADGWRTLSNGSVENIYNGQTLSQAPLVLPTAYGAPHDPMAGAPLPSGSKTDQQNLAVAMSEVGYGSFTWQQSMRADLTVSNLEGLTAEQLQTAANTNSGPTQIIAQSVLRLNRYVGEATIKYASMTPSQLESLLEPGATPNATTTLNQTTATVAGAVLVSQYTKQYQGMSYDQVTQALTEKGLTPFQTAALTQLSVKKAPATFADIQVDYNAPSDAGCGGSGAGTGCAGSGSSNGMVNMGAVFGGFSSYNGAGSGQNAPPVSSGLRLAATVTTGVVLSAALMIGTGGAGLGIDLADGAADLLVPETAIGTTAANAASRAAMAPALFAAKVGALLGVPAVAGVLGASGGAAGTLLNDLGGFL